MHSGYRPDIDGLRAVAVVAVIIYHLNPAYLPGGFTGVDIFFVISGFLITSIIRRELRDGTFSFMDFYASRVRRIYPALLLVIVVTMAAGYVLMLPPDYALLGESAKWAAAGLSNFFFLSETGYFGLAARRLPLLHTWSLGVEEQFYLIWPLLAWLAWKMWARARALAFLALLIVVASFLYTLAIRPGAPDLAFYSPMARAWELALGALAATLPPLRNRWLSHGTAIVGAIFVALCFYYARGKGTPMALALGCIGTMLLVLPTHSPTIVGWGLSFWPARFLGRISYSLYLWHWPVLILWSHFYLVQDRLPHVYYLPYGIGIVILATLSWRFVEQPARAVRAPSRRIIATGVVAAGTVIALGFSLTASLGLPARIPEKAAHYASYIDGHRLDGPKMRCWSSSNTDPARFQEDRCVTLAQDKPNVLLIGDSHANQFFRAFGVVFPEIHLSYVGASGCFPLLHTTGVKRCTDMMDKVFDTYITQMHFDAVILSAQWRTESDRLHLVPATVDFIKRSGSEVVVLGPNNEYKDDLPTLLAYSVMRGPHVLEGKEDNGPIERGEEAVRQIVADLPVEYYSTFGVTCRASLCETLTPADEPMLMDDNHLSDPGAVHVLEALRQQGLLANLVR